MYISKSLLSSLVEIMSISSFSESNSAIKSRRKHSGSFADCRMVDQPTAVKCGCIPEREDWQKEEEGLKKKIKQERTRKWKPTRKKGRYCKRSY